MKIGFFKMRVESFFLSFQKAKNPNKFVIFGQGRTGSTLLVDLLNSHPKIYCEGELFQPKRSLWGSKIWFPFRYLRGMEVKAKDSIFGFKVKIYQLGREQKMNSNRFLDRLELRGYKIIFLRRNNYLNHALSGIIRIKRKNPFLEKSQTYNSGSFEIPIHKLEMLMEQRAKFQRDEIEYLKGRKYFEVIYEHHLEFADAHQNICNQLFDFIGVERTKVKTKFQKINKKKPEDLLLNYKELKLHFIDSPYEKFF